MDRREFVGLAGALVAAGAAGEGAAALPQASPPRRYDPDVWHQRMKRIVHVNFNERDPEGFDVEAWAELLTQCQAQMT